MSKLQEFLDVLTDSELANFYLYRYEQFLQGSKDKIDAELVKRNISKENIVIDDFQKTVLSSDTCPRCKSQKFYNSTETETITYSYASVDLKVDYKTCLVCLYSEEQESRGTSHNFVGPFGFIQALINRKK